MRKIWADIGYAGKLVGWASAILKHRRVELERVRRSDKEKRFELLPRRWVVECTFAWRSQQAD